MNSSKLIMIFLPFFLSAPQTTLKKKKKIDKAFIPIISCIRSFGGQLGALANAYFDISEKDTVSPPSMIGFMGTGFTCKDKDIYIFTSIGVEQYI